MRLSKMDAVGCLCEIKDMIQKNLVHDKKALADGRDSAVDPHDMNHYIKVRIEEEERHIQALEMAGRSMTR